MIKKTISTAEARRFYDRLGAGHDRAEFYEGKAKRVALARLRPAPGQRVLNVGAGTGKEHALIQAAVTPGGHAFGLDLSPVMAKLARARTGAALSQGDARCLPYPTASFDRLFCCYVLDLIAADDLPPLLAEFRRVLKPGGRMVLVSITEGVNLPSRTLVAVWKIAYRISPVACGGCRPLQLAEMVSAAGFQRVKRQVVVQLAFPSEIIAARR